MSKLNTVRTALQSNTKIQIVSAREINHFPSSFEGWTHTINFVVAPNQGLYTAKQLQEFMMLLVPGLEPTTKDDFRDRDLELEFGKLYFDEVIGNEAVRREFTMTDTDFLPADVLKDGKAVLEETRNLNRRVWVRLYPDLEIAMLSEQHKYRIPRRELNEFKSRSRKIGFVGRMIEAVRA